MEKLICPHCYSENTETVISHGVYTVNPPIEFKETRCWDCSRITFNNKTLKIADNGNEIIDGV